MDRLFVYGSLQPGGPNAHILETLHGDWQPASIRGRLVNDGWGSSIGFPGLIIDSDADEIPGHVLRSADLASNWARLDAFEGDEYRRITTQVSLDNGDSVLAQVYVLRTN